VSNEHAQRESKDPPKHAAEFNPIGPLRSEYPESPSVCPSSISVDYSIRECSALAPRGSHPIAGDYMISACLGTSAALQGRLVVFARLHNNSKLLLELECCFCEPAPRDGVTAHWNGRPGTSSDPIQAPRSRFGQPCWRCAARRHAPLIWGTIAHSKSEGACTTTYFWHPFSSDNFITCFWRAD